MAQILYYSRYTGESRRQADECSDDALAALAPTSPHEVAVATLWSQGGRIVYGYDGGWHDQQPREWYQIEAREARERIDDLRAMEARVVPRARLVIVRCSDRGVEIGRRGLAGQVDDIACLSWSTLEEAARQDDEALALIYGAALRTARWMRASQTVRTNVEVRPYAPSDR